MGALLLKTFRVYAIFTAAHSLQKVTNLQDGTLMKYGFALFLLPTLLLSASVNVLAPFSNEQSNCDPVNADRYAHIVFPCLVTLMVLKVAPSFVVVLGLATLASCTGDIWHPVYGLGLSRP
jgi:hypothetical protein